jgi:ferric-dicitrate binding protein FerR (iron transport regulator)
MIVVLLGIGFYLLQPTNAAGNGEMYAFSLPDQSQVLLNAGSQASFKSWDWSSNRAVSLQGEAYFKVAKGQKFTVETNWARSPYWVPNSTSRPGTTVLK